MGRHFQYSEYCMQHPTSTYYNNERLIIITHTEMIVLVFSIDNSR